jgi:ABC-type transporter Mla subunit MlaD
MDERDKKTELLVGLFLFIGLLLLGGLILQFGSVRELLKTTYEITAPFPDATGVKQDTPVMLGGSKIGKVPRMPKLNDNFNGVIIPMEIYQDKKIPKDAKFSIGTAGLLGDSFIEIRPTGASANAYLEPGAAVPESQVSLGSGLSAMQGTLDQIGKKADVVLAEAADAAKELKDALKRVNQGALSDPTLEHFRKTMEKLDSAMTNVDANILGKENANNLKAAIADIKDAAASFKRTSSSLENTSSKLGATLDKLDPAVSKADQVMTSLNEALVSFKGAADNLSDLTKDFGKMGNDGLLPALMADDKLKDDFTSLISNMRRHGVLFYRDGGEDAKGEASKEQQMRLSPLGRPGR